jgi:cytidylate kinase
MPIYPKETRYVPGTYVKKRPDAAELSNRYIKEWEEKRLETQERGSERRFPPTICFSRKIGVGALEIADMVGAKIGYKVADGEILEHIAGEANLRKKTVAFFDERYPGKLSELLAMAFGEKAFIQSDYTRLLFSAVLSLAGLGPTIFVGRGTHLLLPRERVLAVRLFSSREHRLKRLAQILKAGENKAEEVLDQSDRDQRNFYISVYGKKDASPYEFDLVINCDYIKEPAMAAEIVETALKQKFSEELETV